MKKLLVIMGLLLLAIPAMAQDEGTGLTAKGFKAGINLANFTGDQAGDSDMKLGIAAGGFLTYNFSPQFAIQPELLYIMKGAKHGSGDAEEKMKLDYLEVPLMFKFAIPSQGNFKPCLFAGPSFGFLMSAKHEEAGESVDIKDDVKSMDMGLSFGGGFGVAMAAGGMVTFDVRYTMGMSSIDDTGDDADIKNTGIMILLGYGF